MYLPHFLSLAKKSRADHSTVDILNDDGLPFNSDEDRKEYVTNFFQKLYRKDENVAGSIDDFLGDQILANPAVQASKLSDNEKTILDKQLSIEELDLSIKNSNMKSAPGEDGYSNRFLYKFWEFFRWPLFNCINEGVEKGSLLELFKTADIKLIPKKGDCTKIKNWRPISLLSNFYKIFSRAINERLKKIVNRCLSRAQKGFTKSRQIQEVIINTLENIDYCKLNNIQGAMLSIDIKKAFDSVDQDYFIKVYEFFNFGPRIISWLSLIGTNRNAKIVFEDGSRSNLIELLCGTAQGDSPSPILYNLAAQILVFKLEYDPSIKKIRQQPEVGGPRYPSVIPFNFESNRETSNCELFADDENTFTLLDFESLQYIKDTLDAFGDLSGLRINVEKCTLMRIGNLEGDIPDSIINLGFEVVSKITLLGYVIRNDSDTVSENFLKVREKLKNIIRFWSRFRLTLSGKITVCKSLLLPHFNYVASIMNPDPVILAELQDIIDNFCVKGLNVSKTRYYISASEGGLGLINLEEMKTALQANWVKRAFTCMHDNWRYDLWHLSNGYILDIEPEQIPASHNGILKGIVRSFSKFREKFYLYGTNYLYSHCLRNNLMRMQIAAALGHELAEETVRDWHIITWSDLVNDSAILPRRVLSRRLGCELNGAAYELIKKRLAKIQKACYAINTKGKSLMHFLLSFKKGTKSFRNIINRVGTKAKNQNKQVNKMCKSFTNSLNLTNCNTELFSKVQNSWAENMYPAPIRTFLFKYYNNSLGTNSRVAHFNELVDASCTFCTKSVILPSPKESVRHIFFDCPQVLPVIETFYLRTFNGIMPTPENFFGGGGFGGSNEDDIFATRILDVLKFYIWENKLAKRSPSPNAILREVSETLALFVRINKNFEFLFYNSTIFRR
jgi:Reverse transcriptase (RNA-dependent DNA polymerase)